MKHNLSCLLLGTNGLGKIAIQGHMAVLVKLAVIQFNSSDKSLGNCSQGPVLSVNLPWQLKYAISPWSICCCIGPVSLLGLQVAE